MQNCALDRPKAAGCVGVCYGGPANADQGCPNDKEPLEGRGPAPVSEKRPGEIEGATDSEYGPDGGLHAVFAHQGCGNGVGLRVRGDPLERSHTVEELGEDQCRHGDEEGFVDLQLLARRCGELEGGKAAGLAAPP